MNSEAVQVQASVIVAGAGPAGLIAALHLARAGVDVMVIDRGLPEQMGRGLRVAVDERAFAEAGLDFPETPVRLTSPQYRELVSPDNRYKLKLGELFLVRVDLPAFLTEIAAAAQEAGARLLFETELTGPILDDDRVVGAVGTSAGGRLLEAFAPIVIDATGAAAAIRSGLPASTGIPVSVDPGDFADAWQASHEIDREMVRELMAKNRLRPQTNVCRVGFAGAFSLFSVFLDLDDDRVDITAGVPAGLGGPSASEVVERYVDTHHWIRETISEGGGMVPVRRPLNTMVADGILLAGDSACQALPTCGAGVASALLAGKLAAETAVEALQKGEPHADALWQYNVRYMAARGVVQVNGELYRRFLARLEPDELSKLMSRRVLTAEGAKGAIEGMPLELPKGAAMSMIAKPGLALRMYKLNRAVHAALDHCNRYPSNSDPGALERWGRGLEKFFPA